MQKFQLVIPMSGVGQRFKAAGYETLKPLIKVNGKSIIEHVRSMYPEDIDCIFICSKEHLDDESLNLNNLLLSIDPNSKIIGIQPHKKGPAWAIKEAWQHISPSKGTFVNYCDFYAFWDFQRVLSFIERINPAGLLTSYRGAHPHTVWENSYAHIKHVGDRVINIQEKKPFTERPLEEFKSTGTYYFSSGELLLRYINRQFEGDYSLNGEFYSSLTYQPMLEDGLDVRHFELKHFFQWGTPEDLEDFRWYMSNHQAISSDNGLLDLPFKYSLCLLCGGKGERFLELGFLTPKPLIPFRSGNLLSSSIQPFNDADWKGIILSPSIKISDSDEYLDGFTTIRQKNHSSGQATSALELLDSTPSNGPVCIASCDIQLSLDAPAKFFEGLADLEEWLLIFTLSGRYPFARRRPSSYSWVGINGNSVENFSFKSRECGGRETEALSGTFLFSSKAFAQKYISRVIEERDGTDEPYVDHVIPEILKDDIPVFSLPAAAIYGLGTPDEYCSFVYYNDCLPEFLDGVG